MRNHTFSLKTNKRVAHEANSREVDDDLYADSERLHLLVDFVVLGATYYVSCMILSVELGGSLFFHMLAYSTILVTLVRLSKRAIANYYKSIGESTGKILGNAIGILVGTCIMLLIEKLLSNHNEIILAVILSSVMAFFVLGTLSSFARKTSLGHK
jgi:uncharacterized protein YacL